MDNMNDCKIVVNSLNTELNKYAITNGGYIEISPQIKNSVVHESVCEPILEPIKYKYNEDKILAELKKYLDKTYGQHYNTNKEVTCFDAWIALGDATPTFRNTAIKYLWRYGKKNGNNKADLLKALHYIFMCLHNDHYKD